MTVRISLALVLAATVACAAWSWPLAQGMALGGIAGTLGFWMLARRVQKFASLEPAQLNSEIAKGMLLRMVVYGLALWRAWSLDPETYHPLLAAVAGIFIPRLVIYFLAFTSLDLSQEKS